MGSSATQKALPTKRPLWEGRTLAVVGIIVVAFNLRTAVTAMSAITAQISQDIVLTDTALGIIGMLPPLMLAAGGLLGPVLTRWISLELNLLLSISVMIIGHIMRSMAHEFPGLLAGSIVAMLGMGVGNVLLPALVKEYFPDRIALMTSLYAMLFSISSALPGVVAPMMADAAGWRSSLALWALLAAVSVPPWIVLLIRQLRTKKSSDDKSQQAIRLSGRAGLPVWRSRVAWGLLMMYGLTSLNGYAMLAWLPEMLIEESGVSSLEAGALLSLYAVVVGPLALIVPAITIRLRNPGVLSYIGAATFCIGYLGLMFSPGFVTALWVFVAALGKGLFSVMLALINTRTRTSEVTAALSGFVQGLGALISVAGPLIVGILRDISGGWTLPYIFLISTTAGILLSGFLLKSPKIVDDELGILDEDGTESSTS